MTDEYSKHLHPSARRYTHSDADILWRMKDEFDIPDAVFDLTINRTERTVSSNNSSRTWRVPDDWNLT